MKDLDLEGVKRFHGHWCPGLAMGIRVAEVALNELGPHSEDEEMVAVVETDNCAVDAIQYLTGCTFGKGNLIHLDYGKNAFSFYRRADGKAIRIVPKPRSWEPSDPALRALAEKAEKGEATEQDKERLRQARIEDILNQPLAGLFSIQEVTTGLPAEARIHQSVTCAECKERVMETRARLFGEETYCLPCFQARNQRF